METLASLFSVYVHNLNPFAIRITSSFGIRWYGLAYLTGFLFSYWIVKRMAKAGRSQLRVDEVSDFIFTVALGTIIGGRLGYCIFYGPELFTSFSSTPPFWGVLAINQGGMASHGGIIGIVIASLYYGRKHGIKPLHLMDLTTLGGTVGVFFGRIANFVNGELVGRPVASPIPWAVKFPQDLFLWPTEEPARLATLSPVVQQVGVTPERWNTLVSNLPSSSAYRAIEGVLGQIVAQIQSGNRALANALEPLLTARHPSQLYESLLEGLLLFLLLIWIWRKPRKPGIIASSFISAYAVVRIFGEQFRMPDPQIGFQALGLTRGQWLSMIMFVIGLLLFYCCRQSKAEPI